MQAFLEAMAFWPRAEAVHHACLQCLVALCKDNAMMKAHVAVVALPATLASLSTHAASPAVVERGFTLLGVLQSGGDHLNDGIRRLQAEAGLLSAAAAALPAAAARDEAALAAVCFAVAMVLRGGEEWRGAAKQRATRSPLLSQLCAAETVRTARLSPVFVLSRYACVVPAQGSPPDRHQDRAVRVCRGTSSTARPRTAHQTKHSPRCSPSWRCT